MNNGVGYFPSLFALQFTGGIPDGGGTFMEEESKRRRWIQTILKVITLICFVVFLTV